MTHWSNIPDYPVPEHKTWEHDQYKELAALPPDDLLRVAWNLACANVDGSWQLLDLAQDLSIEFEMLNYANTKEEFRHEESLRRQDVGMEFMQRVYELAGFSHERRAQLARSAEELMRTGATVIDPAPTPSDLDRSARG